MYESCVKLPIDAGNVPPNQVLDSCKLVRDVRPPNDEGSVP
jgi:hypothetical protein